MPVHSEPFAGRNPNPLKYILGQPAALAATLPATGTVHWSLGMYVTNTLNLESAHGEALVFDYEAYSTDFSLTWSWAQDWALKLDVPLIYRGGGVFDSAIDSWHRALGLSRASRGDVADDQFQISYLNNGVTETSLVSATRGLGDIQLGIGHQLRNTAEDVIGAWLIAELPSGDLAELSGNDKTDISLVLAWQHRLNASWLSFNNLGVLFPGSDTLVTANVAERIGFGHTGLLWRPDDAYALKLQLNGHSRFYENSQLQILGSAWSLVFGGTLYINRCSQLDLAVEEDIKVDASPDVSVLLHWTTKLCQ